MAIGINLRNEEAEDDQRTIGINSELHIPSEIELEGMGNMVAVDPASFGNFMQEMQALGREFIGPGTTPQSFLEAIFKADEERIEKLAEEYYYDRSQEL